MPQQQDDADDVKTAQSYVNAQNATYTSQGKPGSSENRLHVDSASQRQVGGAYKANLKPVPPPCDGRQFDENKEYFELKFDSFNNPLITQDRPMHETGVIGDKGRYGNQQFSSASDDIQGGGYGSNMGLNVIEHGQSAAFNQSERTSVDVSKADRGSDS